MRVVVQERYVPKTSVSMVVEKTFIAKMERSA